LSSAWPISDAPGQSIDGKSSRAVANGSRGVMGKIGQAYLWPLKLLVQ
jgi:hypothetical protein